MGRALFNAGSSCAMMRLGLGSVATDATVVMSTQIPGFIAILLYLLTSFLLIRRLLPHGGTPQLGKAGALILGLGGALLHGGPLYPLLVTAGGLNLGFFNAVSFISLLTAVLLLFAAVNRPVENLGIVVLPVAALSIS